MTRKTSQGIFYVCPKCNGRYVQHYRVTTLTENTFYRTPIYKSPRVMRRNKKRFVDTERPYEGTQCQKCGYNEVVPWKHVEHTKQLDDLAVQEIPRLN